MNVVDLTMQEQKNKQKDKQNFLDNIGEFSTALSAWKKDKKLKKIGDVISKDGLNKDTITNIKNNFGLNDNQVKDSLMKLGLGGHEGVLNGLNLNNGNTGNSVKDLLQKFSSSFGTQENKDLMKGGTEIGGAVKKIGNSSFLKSLMGSGSSTQASPVSKTAGTGSSSPIGTSFSGLSSIFSSLGKAISGLFNK